MIRKLTKEQQQSDRQAVTAMIAKLQATVDHERAVNSAREARSRRVSDNGLNWIG